MKIRKSAQKSFIKTVRVCILEAPLIHPFRISTGQHDSLHNVLLILRLNDGTCGFGEAAIATHITGETVESTIALLRRVAPHLKGRFIGDYHRILTELGSDLDAIPSARTAVEMALLDALTQTLNIPLWRFFGTRAERLSTDITLVIADAEQTHDSVRGFVRAGFRRFKIKVGLDPASDLDRVRIVHAAAPRAGIILDANQGFSAPAALKFLQRLARFGIRPILVEQPVHRNDWDAMRWITRRSPSPVCADESLQSVADVVRIIQLGAAHAINIKLAKFGFLQSIQMAALARASDLSLMIGSMMETNLSATAAAHFAAGIGGFDFVDLDTPFFIPDHADQNPYLSPNGIYDLVKCASGIGIQKVSSGLRLRYFGIPRNIPS